jgi:hypothetical protein
MSELKSKHLFDLTIQLHPIIEVGATPAGERRIVPVSGGHDAAIRIAERQQRKVVRAAIVNPWIPFRFSRGIA